MTVRFLLFAIAAELFAAPLPHNAVAAGRPGRVINPVRPMGQPGPALRTSFTEVHINSSLFCSTANTPECSHEINRLLTKLMALNPVPVPQRNSGLPVSVAAADRLYRQFLAAHRGEPLAAVFQQVFPRILLTRYNLIDGTNYSLIAYYAQQLIENQSYDFVLQEKALSLLRPHLSPVQFNRLVTLTNANARAYKPVYEQQYQEQLLSLADTTGRFYRDPRFRATIVAMKTRVKNQMLTDYQLTNQAMTQLEQMQRTSTN